MIRTLNSLCHRRLRVDVIRSPCRLRTTANCGYRKKSPRLSELSAGLGPRVGAGETFGGRRGDVYCSHSDPKRFCRSQAGEAPTAGATWRPFRFATKNDSVRCPTVEVIGYARDRRPLGASIRLLPSYGSHSASLRPQDQVHGLHFFPRRSSQHPCCDRLVERTSVVSCR
jgi:hypothetical protein